MSASTPRPSGDLSPVELRAWRSLIETTTRLRTRLDAQLLADSGLTGSEYPILLALVEADEPELRCSELATRIGWERSRLSHQLGRMERRGLVRRTAARDDNRGSCASLTADGRRRFLRATVAHSAAVRAGFVQALSDRQLRQLSSIMDALARHLD